jgi:Na+-transporting methylmalonyl-CoA/oxaloacetate decarboxylase gamma subunit
MSLVNQNLHKNNYLMIAGLALVVASLALLSYFIYTTHHQKVDDFKLNVPAQKYNIVKSIK